MIDWAKLGDPAERERRRLERERREAELEAYWRTVAESIEKLEAARERLTDWEARFVESTGAYLRLWGYLSERQLAALRRVYRRIRP